MDEFKPLNDWEYQRMMEVLKANANKTFVQRILRPNDFPVLEHDGGIATHRMAWGELPNGRAAAFPTVLYDGKGLKDYGDKAWEQAHKTGNVIEFDSPDEASWFAQNYKGAWGGLKNKPPR
jgi:hypothetical protein